ncbi:MAG: hypothetical protein ABI867_33235 [Kofleriaceae bacterium]
MRLIGLFAILSLVACAADDDGHFPVNPGGGGGVGGGGGGSGSGSSGDDGGVPFPGTVCLLTDMRKIGTACNSQGTGVVTVTLGTATTDTLTNGTFTIGLPTGSNLEWKVEGDGVRTSITPFETGVMTIPAVPEALYIDLLSANGGVEIAGQGAVVVQHLRGTAPLTDVVVSAVGRTILYDDNISPTVWDTEATGPLGVAWIRETPVGNLTFQSDPTTGSSKSTSATVGDGAVTFVTIDL